MKNSKTQPSASPQVSALSPQPSEPQVSGFSPQPSAFPQFSGLSPQPSSAPPQVSGFSPQPSGDVLIRVENVSKKFCRNLKKSLWYGMKDLGSELLGRRHGGKDGLRPEEFWAVNDVSFELRRGECLGLIGRNGAGKTTLLRMLNGLIKPDKGRIEMRGRVGALIALGAGFNPILTGRENIYVNASVLGLTKKETDEKFDEIVEFAELGEFIDAPVQSYSSGMAVRLGFAIAVKTEPDILLLDEVLAVGDVGFQAKCFNTLAQFRERGIGFILVSHNMHQISRYSENVLYLKQGNIEYYGNHEFGIDKYLIDMQQCDSGSENDRTDWSRIYGSGKVVFTGVRFRNALGDEVTMIDVGDSVTLEIDYERRTKLEELPVIDVLIRDRDGVVFQGTSAKFFSEKQLLNSCGKFKVSFRSLIVNTEYLEFFVAALDPKTAEVFDWKRHIRLLVRRLANQHGKLSLPVEWNLT